MQNKDEKKYKRDAKIESILGFLMENPNNFNMLVEQGKKDWDDREEMTKDLLKRLYGEENVDWMLISHKLDGIVVELGDDSFYEREDIELVRYSLGNCVIKYKGKVVFKIREGYLEMFDKETLEWINKINKLWENI